VACRPDHAGSAAQASIVVTHDIAARKGHLCDRSHLHPIDQVTIIAAVMLQWLPNVEHVQCSMWTSRKISINSRLGRVLLHLWMIKPSALTTFSFSVEFMQRLKFRGFHGNDGRYFHSFTCSFNHHILLLLSITNH
jgi:hypothetical protein